MSFVVDCGNDNAANGGVKRVCSGWMNFKLTSKAVPSLPGLLHFYQASGKKKKKKIKMIKHDCDKGGLKNVPRTKFIIAFPRHINVGEGCFFFFFLIE